VENYEWDGHFVEYEKGREGGERFAGNQCRSRPSTPHHLGICKTQARKNLIFLESRENAKNVERREKKGNWKIGRRRRTKRKKQQAKNRIEPQCPRMDVGSIFSNAIQ
jgi:hypothetical protein